MKKILFITAFPPSKIGAGVNYTRQLLDEISSFMDVDLIYFRQNNQKEYVPYNETIKIRKIFQISSLEKLFSVLIVPFIFPLFTAKFSILKLLKIDRIIKTYKYDVIYFDFSQMFLYTKFLKHDCKILMSHDIIGQRYIRKHPILGKWASFCEKRIIKGNNKVFTFSNKDTKLLKEWYNKDSIPTSFYFNADIINARPSIIEDYFVFFAMWKRSDNYLGLKWFIDKVLPSQDQNFKAIIIGGNMPEDIKKLIENTDNLEYKGYLDNPYPIIANSRALISPLFQGAGVKVKVLDSLACGTPVIGTDISFEGIDDDFDSFMFRANDEYGFTNAIKGIDVPIDKRLSLKNHFLTKSKSKEVVKYLKQI